MKKTVLFGLLVSILVCGFAGCSNSTTSNDNTTENNTINLTAVSGENAVRLTLKGATWNGDVETNLYGDLALRSILKWTRISGDPINDLSPWIAMVRTRESDTVLKVSFSKGSAFTGTGTIELQIPNGGIASALYMATSIDLFSSWKIGENDPVPITIQ